MAIDWNTAERGRYYGRVISIGPLPPKKRAAAKPGESVDLSEQEEELLREVISPVYAASGVRKKAQIRKVFAKLGVPIAS